MEQGDLLGSAREEESCFNLHQTTGSGESETVEHCIKQKERGECGGHCAEGRFNSQCLRKTKGTERNDDAT